MEGLTIQGQWVSLRTLEDDYACRVCLARLGKPYQDPDTGALDFERLVCRGETPHEILTEDDVIPLAMAEWIDAKHKRDGEEVMRAYPWLFGREQCAPGSLYPDESFEGFD